jgi:hypothetical protein
MTLLPLIATLFEKIWHVDFWYALPAIVVISLVYSATRHEDMTPILRHALRLGLWITGCMGIFFVILGLLSHYFC